MEHEVGGIWQRTAYDHVLQQADRHRTEHQQEEWACARHVSSLHVELAIALKTLKAAAIPVDIVLRQGLDVLGLQGSPSHQP